MKLSARGWGRDMGPTEIMDDHSLSELGVSEEGGSFYKNGTPAVFQSFFGVAVSWHRKLRLTGDYRLDLVLTYEDITMLFKAAFGEEITPSMLRRYGLKLSPELDKAALAKIKLGDLTLAELAALMKPTEEGNQPEPA